MLEFDNYSVKIFEKEFVAKSEQTSKELYLEVCKYLAINVYSSPSYSEKISVKVVKGEKDVEALIRQKKTGKIIKEKQTRTTFTVSLYCDEDLKGLMEKHCSDCKHLHTIFFALDKPSCEECKLMVLQKKMNSEIKVMAERLGNELREKERKSNE